MSANFNDDDTMAAGIILVAVVIIVWACTGCASYEQLPSNPPARIDATTPHRLQEPMAATSEGSNAAGGAILSDSGASTQPTLEPATPRLMAATTTVAVTNIAKRGRFVCPRTWSKEQFEAWKRARGYQ